MSFAGILGMRQSFAASVTWVVEHKYSTASGCLCHNTDRACLKSTSTQRWWCQNSGERQILGRSFEYVISLNLITLFTLLLSEPVNFHLCFWPVWVDFLSLGIGNTEWYAPPTNRPISLWYYPTESRYYILSCLTLFHKVLSYMRVRITYFSSVSPNAFTQYLVLNKFWRAGWTKQVLWHPGDWLRKVKIQFLPLKGFINYY